MSLKEKGVTNVKEKDFIIIFPLTKRVTGVSQFYLLVAYSSWRDNLEPPTTHTRKYTYICIYTSC